MENPGETEDYLEELPDTEPIEKPKVHKSKGKPLSEQQKANLQKGRDTLIKRKEERILKQADEIKQVTKKKAPPKKKPQIVIRTDDTDDETEDDTPTIIIRNNRRKVADKPVQPKMAFEEPAPEPPPQPKRLKRV